jgi:hypothetical protein
VWRRIEEKRFWAIGETVGEGPSPVYLDDVDGHLEGVCLHAQGRQHHHVPDAIDDGGGGIQR